MPNVSKRNKPRHMSGKPAKQTAKINQGPDEAPIGATQESIAMQAPSTAAGFPSYQATKLPTRTVKVPRTSAAVQTNYDYVVKDLRRIGITAVCIFVAMGILAVILPMVNH